MTPYEKITKGRSIFHKPLKDGITVINENGT